MKKIFTLFLFTLVSSFLFGQDCPTLVDTDGNGRIIWNFADMAATVAAWGALPGGGDDAITVTGGSIDGTALADPLVFGKTNNAANRIVGGTTTFIRSSGQNLGTPNTTLSGTVTFHYSGGDVVCEYADGVLPVLYARFNAEKQAKTALLSWTTGSEINNDYFVIERSKDSKNYTKIGEIKGAGNSAEFVDYRFTDENPAEGVNYYRLRQVDFDGAENMSAVKVVQMNNRGATALTVYPTLTEDNVTVDLTDYNETELNAKIISVSGTLVRSFTLSGATKSTVNVAELMPGVYLMSVQSKGSIATGKFVVK